ncbi:MAG TPA: phosphatidylglycerophosphatase A [Verrucomicrobiae bacterium]|nr:phosphatidylglycerophosphatase A [Verrucomicrobiae bacterium]
MRERLIRFLATGFGVGYIPAAPGTAGSVLGIGFWWALTQLRSAWLAGLVFVVAVVFAVWCAGAAAEAMRHPDPPSVVIDEIVAMPLAMMGVVGLWWHVLVAFALFRLFDIWKPPPVGDAQSFSGGIGIVLDDLLAAAYACLGTHLVVWAAGRFG